MLGQEKYKFELDIEIEKNVIRKNNYIYTIFSTGSFKFWKRLFVSICWTSHSFFKKIRDILNKSLKVLIGIINNIQLKEIQKIRFLINVI